MKRLNKLIILGIAVLGIIVAKSENEEIILSDSVDLYGEEAWVTNSGSFTELPAYNDFDMSEVVIFIPRNCGKKNALRGKYLAKRLTNLDVPVSVRDSIAFNFNNSHERQQINSVMSEDIPIVLVGNKGKSNPSLRQVLYEYYLLMDNE